VVGDLEVSCLFEVMKGPSSPDSLVDGFLLIILGSSVYTFIFLPDSLREKKGKEAAEERVRASVDDGGRTVMLGLVVCRKKGL